MTEELELHLERPTVRHLHQGAVCARTPVIWLPDQIRLLRQATGGGFSAVAPRDDLTPPPFHGSEADPPMEAVVAMAKLRPVIVVSSRGEIAGAPDVRVVPLHSYVPGSALAAARDEIKAGERPQWLHVAPFGSQIHESAARLDHQQPVPTRHVTAPPVATVTSASLNLLLQRLADYALLV